MRRTALRVLSVSAITLFLIIANVAPGEANHSWGGSLWARTSNPFTVQLGDNLSASWKPYLASASSDWTQSAVLHTTVVAGAAKGNCRPTSGRVEICNRSYGFNGWLGVAQISVTGGTHITQGVVKLNDSYFDLAQYNNNSEKLHVVCQEVGHTFGLDHQDTSGASLNTCMDYYQNTSASDTRSTHPNQHDYDELVTIYTHLDSNTTIATATAAAPSAVGANADENTDEEGAPRGASPSRGSWYVEDQGGGRLLVTHVFWADQSR